MVEIWRGGGVGNVRAKKKTKKVTSAFWLEGHSIQLKSQQQSVPPAFPCSPLSSPPFSTIGWFFLPHHTSPAGYSYNKTRLEPGNMKECGGFNEGVIQLGTVTGWDFRCWRRRGWCWVGNGYSWGGRGTSLQCAGALSIGTGLWYSTCFYNWHN